MELILLVVGDSLTLTVISSNSALAYGIRVLLVLPHHHQAKKGKYPKKQKMSFLVIKNKSVILGDSFSMTILRNTCIRQYLNLSMIRL
ncbi:hypothetical protein DJ94_4849 [Bacillus pseudomycoides]|nr:hypothetical protein DJ94_4849 [Bacillus pseudomycoides]